MQINTDERGAATAKKTAEPIGAGEVAHVFPEFCRVPDVERLFGLRRSILYQLIAAGRVKSVCLRKPGAKTGVRLVHLARVRAFLTEHME